MRLQGIFFLFLLISCSSPTPDLSQMIKVPAGEMQLDSMMVQLDSFQIDAYEVSIKAFGEFIAATGYTTTADSLGWSGVFDFETGAWQAVDGATWLYPKGSTKPKGAPFDPVTQVSIYDAQAYAQWAGKQLPSRAEWIYAASSMGKYKEYAFPESQLQADPLPGNWWQGPFPYVNTLEDGFLEVAPVGSFAPNDIGCYDMAGNVWEWTTDTKIPGDTNANPQMYILGGSFLCDYNYCRGFNFYSNQFTPKDSGNNNLGFRCIRKYTQ